MLTILAWYVMRFAPTCNSGYYQEVTTKKCLICDNSCKECWGAGPTKCMICKPNTWLQVAPICNYGYCPDVTTKNCLICNMQRMFRCGSYKSMKPKIWLQVTVGPSQCLSTCPSHTFKDNSIYIYICQVVQPWGLPLVPAAIQALFCKPLLDLHPVYQHTQLANTQVLLIIHVNFVILHAIRA